MEVCPNHLNILSTHLLYSLYKDIEAELIHYPDAFRGKTVYCNCDDPLKSNFFKYFYDHFHQLGLKKLIATGYNKDGRGIKCVYEGRQKVLDDKKLILTKKYDPEKYPKYDNYDAIECGKVADIPYDYDGVIGVPITVLQYKTSSDNLTFYVKKDEDEKKNKV